MAFDERFEPIESTPEEIYAQRKIAVTWARNEAKKLRGPISREAIHEITTNLQHCLDMCRESREALDLKGTLTDALIIVGQIQRSRPV